jgi:hypothetical protein
MKSQARCGTPSGYRKHLRMRKKACTACKEANSAYNRDYKMKMARAAAMKDPNAQVLLNPRARAPFPCPRSGCTCQYYEVWTNRVVWRCGLVHHFTRPGNANGSAPEPEPNPVVPDEGSRAR